MIIGKKLKELRNNLGISQRELASRLTVSAGTVAMWETNKREPDFEMLLRIANFFNVSAVLQAALKERLQL